jgi:hypothetical protein
MRKLKFFGSAAVFLSMIYIYLKWAQPSSAYQRSAPSEIADTNPYSKHKDQELIAAAKAFVKRLRALNEEFRKMIDGISAGDKDSNSKIEQIPNIQDKYARNFETQARDLEQELLKRLPKDAKPTDAPAEIASMLIKSGRLAGADPADTIASYIEVLATKLQSRLKTQK